METYKSITGVVLEVYQTGKSFKTIRHDPATKRVAAETRVKKHRCYSGVEKQIAKWRVS
jgi:hypothetical protein